MAAVWSSSKKIKFHYGYGGKFRRTDNGGTLRYVGGTNKIITVDRRISYTELIVKLWDSGVPSMSLVCKLPGEESFSLVHVKSDKDLAFVIGIYEQTGKVFKIRAFLDPLPPHVDDYMGKDTMTVFSYPLTRSTLSKRRNQGRRR
ncbi:hypothetical protein LXL04_007070 [Taraxacum kok-saghyz]